MNVVWIITETEKDFGNQMHVCLFWEEVQDIVKNSRVPLMIYPVNIRNNRVPIAVSLDGATNGRADLHITPDGYSVAVNYDGQYNVNMLDLEKLDIAQSLWNLRRLEHHMQRG